MWQFLKSALSENSEPSSKRLISFLVAICLCFILIWATVKYPNYILHLSDASMVFILILLGVATLSQILAIVRPGSNTDTTKP